MWDYIGGLLPYFLCFHHFFLFFGCLITWATEVNGPCSPCVNIFVYAYTSSSLLFLLTVFEVSRFMRETETYDLTYNRLFPSNKYRLLVHRNNLRNIDKNGILDWNHAALWLVHWVTIERIRVDDSFSSFFTSWSWFVLYCRQTVSSVSLSTRTPFVWLYFVTNLWKFGLEKPKTVKNWPTLFWICRVHLLDGFYELIPICEVCHSPEISKKKLWRSNWTHCLVATEPVFSLLGVLKWILLSGKKIELTFCFSEWKKRFSSEN